jgi:opine dehydrogenase
MNGPVAVIGAGNGGLAFAAFLGLAGLDVRLYDTDPAVLRPLSEQGGVHLLQEDGDSFVKISMTTTDLDAALAGCRWVMVATPASSHRAVAEAIAPLLEPGCTVVLNPGRTGGALEVHDVLRQACRSKDVVVAETQTLLFACRKEGTGAVRIHGRKARVPVAALPGVATAAAVALLGTVFPEFVAASNVLETSLMNIGAMFHPLPMLCNLGRVESDERGFAYYREGITPSVAAIIEQLDAERLAVAAAFGIKLPRAVDWLTSAYGISATTLYEAIQATPAYAAIKAPREVMVRYITEDVPTGLVPLAALGSLAGVPTPAMDAIVHLAGCATGSDFRHAGRTLTRLGLDGLSKVELLALIG